MKIAFIGTGVMGKPMALHLAKSGYDVTVFNRTLEKAKQLEPECKAVKTIAEAVQNAEIVFSIVGFVDDVKEIYLSKQGILANAKPGTIICDMTTSSPELSVEIAEEAMKHHLIALDAPVTGGDTGAREASLTIMVGGDKKAYQKVLPCFEILGSKIVYMGRAGSGQYAKLANQICVAACLAGCAEGLAFAEQNNLDLNLILEIINSGSAASSQSKVQGKKIITEDFSPGFFVKHIIKDLSLSLEETGDLKLPVTKQILSEFQEIMKNGHGDEGTQALIKYYR